MSRRRGNDFSLDPAQFDLRTARPDVQVAGSLDAAFATHPDAAWSSFVVRGEAVAGAAEFRRRADAAEDASYRDFVISGTDGQVEVVIESM